MLRCLRCSGRHGLRNGQIHWRDGHRVWREWQACRRIGQWDGRISWREKVESCLNHVWTRMGTGVDLPRKNADNTKGEDSF